MRSMLAFAMFWACAPAVADEARQPVITNSIGMKLVSIPAGVFEMGSEEGNEDERPVHPVSLTKPFFLGQTEVTQEQWQKVMGTTPWRNQIYVKEGPGVAASYVNWDDAVQFCQKLTEMEKRSSKPPAGRVYRLPTEAEWEYACRAGADTKWSFGDDEGALKEYAWYDGNASATADRHSHEAGSRMPNAWMLHDMHGNVREWCSDWYDRRYSVSASTSASIVDPKGPAAGTFRVVRGGSWFVYPFLCRSAARTSSPPSVRSSAIGFRVVSESE